MGKNRPFFALDDKKDLHLAYEYQILAVRVDFAFHVPFRIEIHSSREVLSVVKFNSENGDVIYETKSESAKD